MSDTPSSVTQKCAAVHLTLLDFKPTVDEAERERILAIVRSLGSQPTVQHLVIGRAKPSRSGTRDFDYVSIVGFDNETDHDVYLVCDARKDMGKAFMPAHGGYAGADMHNDALREHWENSDAQLRHVMAFTYREDVSDQDVNATNAAIATLRSGPGVKALTVNRNLQPLSADHAPAQWVMFADFADREDREALFASADYKALIDERLIPMTSAIFFGDLPLTPENTGK